MVPEERWPFDLVVEVKEGLAEIRVRVDHLETEAPRTQGPRQDIRRLDARLFQLMLAQIATLATAMGALVATLAA